MKEEIKVKFIDNGEEDIVDNISSHITPTLVFSTFVALLGSLSLGFAVAYPSPVQSEITTDLGLSTSEVLGLADMFYVLGWFPIVICKDAWLLDVGRLMLGFAMGISSFLVPIYIAEFTPRKRRGGFVVLHGLMLTSGASVVFLLGLIVSWRTLALIGMIPSLAQMISLFFIPESPRWLMMIGENEKFESALRQFRGTKVDISLEASDIKVCSEALEENQKVSLIQLFQKKYVYTLTVGIGLSSLSMLVGLNGISSYSRSIFESAGVSEIVGMVALAIFQLPSVVLSIFLTDEYGRRPLLLISSAGLCLGCLLAGLAFTLQDHQLLEGFSPYFALVGILVYITAYAIGLGGISPLIVSEERSSCWRVSV